MKKVVSVALSVIMLANLAVSTAISAAADEQERFPYVLYSNGDIALNSQGVSLNGDIYLNGTYSTLCSYPNMNGSIFEPEQKAENTSEPLISDILGEEFDTSGGTTTSAAVDVTIDATEDKREGMIFLHNKVMNTYFGENCDFKDSAYEPQDMNININNPVFANDGITLDGSVSMNGAIGSLSDIHIDGNNLNGNGTAVYSKYGDITIDSDSAGICGLVYAPFGDVIINSQNFNLNGIIIAKNIIVTASNININYDANVALKIGYTSESFVPSDDEWDYLPDSDDDTLPDIYEEQIGTDPFNADTDGDLLRDDYELYSTGTDPTLYDTDDNGVNDGDEDFDEDSLTNYEEYLNGTNPLYDDTDDDGISDYDELFVHLTDPLDNDTDNDDVLDGDELKLGIDPTLYDTDNDGTYDGAERFAQTYSYDVGDDECAVTEIQIDFADATNYVYRTTDVENIMGIDYLSSNVVGLVGAPFEIETTSSFTSAVLTYKVNTELLGETEFDNLMFLWYDEENGVYVEFETITDAENGTVSTNVTHFSRYMIVDKVAWFDAWKNAPSYTDNETYVPYDTVLVIDTSVSMSTNDLTLAKKAALAYIDTMQENDRTAIITFTDYAKVKCDFTEVTNKSKLEAELSMIPNGGTDFNNAINTALEIFNNNSVSSNKKMVIFMSDGSDSVSSAYLEKILNSGITFNTVGLGNANEYWLKQISNAGKGEYYHAVTANSMVDIYSSIGLGKIDLGPDSDSDGLADVFEAGSMLVNGQRISTDPTNKDTDGDKLLDGEEIVMKTNFKQLVSYAPQHTFVFEMKSCPLASDYSNSGISDFDRVNNTSKYMKSYLIQHNQMPSYTVIKSGTEAFSYPDKNASLIFKYNEDSIMSCYNKVVTSLSKVI